MDERRKEDEMCEVLEGSANFPCKGQRANIFSFADHTTSVTTTQARVAGEAARADMY